MKKVILGLMIFLATSLFATDVSNFDIKGIKLGMSEKELLNILKNKIKCEKIRVYKYYTDIDKKEEGPIISKQYYCHKNNIVEFDIRLDHNMNIYYLDRNLKPTIEPNWNKLKNNILKHYGNTKYIKKTKNQISMCWGSCKFYKFNDSYINNGGRSLSIQLYNHSNHEFDSIDFFFRDSILERDNKQYEQKIIKQQKENASNIDF